MNPQLDELLADVLQISRDVVAGKVDPIVGATAVWRLSFDNDHPFDDLLMPFMSAATQWEEAPQFHDELREDARKAALEFIAIMSENVD